MGTGNNSDTNDDSIGNQDTPQGTDSGSMAAAAQQLQAAISGFVQEAGGGQERLIDLMTNSGHQPNRDAVGTQATSPGPNSGNAQDATQQMQTSVSRFMQEDQRAQQDLNRHMDKPSDQILSLEKKIEDVRREVERNWGLISNYR